MGSRDATHHSIRIEAPPSRVYSALLDPQLIPQWRVPLGMRCRVHAFDPREGGAFRARIFCTSFVVGSIMTPLGLTHTTAAVLALASGAAVLLTIKGTTRHRQFGWVYTASMLGLNGTALFIFRLFGGFGPFHAFAVFSLLTVLLGAGAALAARRHRRADRPVQRARALGRHYAWMTWSYVGLCAAAVSEVATRVPALRPGPGQGVAFGLTVAAATILVLVIGGQLIRRHQAGLLAPYRQSGGQPMSSPTLIPR